MSDFSEKWNAALQSAFPPIDNTADVSRKYLVTHYPPESNKAPINTLHVDKAEAMAQPQREGYQKPVVCYADVSDGVDADKVLRYCDVGACFWGWVDAQGVDGPGHKGLLEVTPEEIERLKANGVKFVQQKKAVSK